MTAKIRYHEGSYWFVSWCNRSTGPTDFGTDHLLALYAMATQFRGAPLGQIVNFKHWMFEFNYLKNKQVMLCSLFAWKHTRVGSIGL